jgi:hypothetical protein
MQLAFVPSPAFSELVSLVRITGCSTSGARQAGGHHTARAFNERFSADDALPGFSNPGGRTAPDFDRLKYFQEALIYTGMMNWDARKASPRAKLIELYRRVRNTWGVFTGRGPVSGSGKKKSGRVSNCVVQPGALRGKRDFPYDLLGNLGRWANSGFPGRNQHGQVNGRLTGTLKIAASRTMKYRQRAGIISRKAKDMGTKNLRGFLICISGDSGPVKNWLKSRESFHPKGFTGGRGA